MAPWKKKYNRVSRDKYSVENHAFTVTTNTSGDGGTVVVPATTLQGMRKVKHLTLSMAAPAGTSNLDVFWALVYVPQGTGVGTLNITGGDMYEPNQYVMSCGIFDFNGGPLRVHCPLSRNLNSGDSIALIIKNSTSVPSIPYNGVVRYAVTLQ